MAAERLVKRRQHKKGGYETMDPIKKVVQRWLQLAELAAPQSDPSWFRCSENPPALTLLPQDVGDSPALQ